MGRENDGIKTMKPDFHAKIKEKGKTSLQELSPQRWEQGRSGLLKEKGLL